MRVICPPPQGQKKKKNLFRIWPLGVAREKLGDSATLRLTGLECPSHPKAFGGDFGRLPFCSLGVAEQPPRTMGVVQPPTDWPCGGSVTFFFFFNSFLIFFKAFIFLKIFFFFFFIFF
jgi:hypothetical protein